ncbi:unnamed protein product [Closterium sp. NIES-53]
MLALCQEHRLEHRTKHIALRYFLARELQQRGQLCLAYVASQANTADVFTKALQPCDHQPCFAFLDWSCDLLFSPTLPMGITGPYSSQWQAAMDAEMASWKSTGTYVDEVPPPRANIVDGMWIFRVKRPPGSPPAFKARYVARGFSQQQGVDYFQTFSPTPKMTTLQLLLHVAAQRDYELHSLDFSTAFLQITQDRARRTITLTQSHMVHQVLQRFGFQYSSPQLTPLSTSHSLSAPTLSISATRRCTSLLTSHQ